MCLGSSINLGSIMINVQQQQPLLAVVHSLTGQAAILTRGIKSALHVYLLGYSVKIVPRACHKYCLQNNCSLIFEKTCTVLYPLISEIAGAGTWNKCLKDCFTFQHNLTGFVLQNALILLTITLLITYLSLLLTIIQVNLSFFCCNLISSINYNNPGSARDQEGLSPVMALYLTILSYER